MKSLKIENLGPIKEAAIEFGDLTVLVGPQASGKSLFVQTYKALHDAKVIRNDLRMFGFDWTGLSDARGRFCESYFGGGSDELVEKTTKIFTDGRVISFDHSVVFAKSKNGSSKESVFLIPAQRVLMMADGWARNFMGFPLSDAYCLKHYSETVRILMERGFGHEGTIFPQPSRLKADIKNKITESIFTGADLKVISDGPRKRLVLSRGQTRLAPGAWSAGQREFTPLLLGLYWLMPPTKKLKQEGIHSVVIEEPEMGLHPQAIVTVGLMILELLYRGYRVIVSTHSPVLLDLVWGLRTLQEEGVEPKRAHQALKQIFSFDRITPNAKQLFNAGLKSNLRTYYFDRKLTGVYSKDISSLDPGSDDPHLAGWGGLSGFSGMIADAVGRALSK